MFLCEFQYSTVVLVLFILEAAAVGVAMLFVDKAETKIKDYLDESLQNRYNGSFTSTETTSILYSSGGDPITLAWDVTQLQVSSLVVHFLLISN